MKNFLDISQVPIRSLKSIIEEAREMKERREGFSNGTLDNPKWLENRIIGLIFEKPSTRTRISFDVGIRQMGGKSIVLSVNDLQLGNGENISDTAKVLSLYLDMVMIRTTDETKLLNFASFSSIPVINGLTDQSHPCQVMADVMTFEELKGSIQGKKVVWVGDGNNVCTSYIHAAVKFGFNLIIASPEQFSPKKSLLFWAKNHGAEVKVYLDPSEAVKNADLVVTDTHLSMHNEIVEAKSRLQILRNFQVNKELMSKAKSDAIFLHCLPAHRNVEVTDDVIDGQQSVVLNAAANRLHVQKALMKWCFHDVT